MKFLGILAAASLALAPALAPAASDSDQGKKKPAAGPLAGRALSQSEIPPAAIIVGGLVIVGGLIVGILGSTDSNNNTNGASVQQ